VRKMYSAGYIIITSALVVFSSISVLGFPDGGPVDACVKPRPNQPYHGQARSQPLNTSPYKILASSSQYEPGSQITGILNTCANIIPLVYIILYLFVTFILQFLFFAIYISRLFILIFIFINLCGQI
jgi:hypothetical protein